MRVRFRLRRNPNYEHIRRLEQELGIGWLKWPEVGYVRDDCRFETLDGRVIPIRDAEREGLLA